MKAGNATYLNRNDLPEQIGLFPLENVLVLPAGYLSLNVFEPRYLALVEDAMKGNRLIGIIQLAPHPDDEAMFDGTKPALYPTGCIARIISYTEIGDGRLLISLQGICRFTCREEIDSDRLYRIFAITPWLEDLIDVQPLNDESRQALLDAFADFLEANHLETDWDHIIEAPSLTLVNALSIAAPFGAAEKQALLEAPNITMRAETLIALAERSILEHDGFKASDLQ